VIPVSEEPQPGASDMPVVKDIAAKDIRPAEVPRLGEVVGHFADQARRTAKAARAGRAGTADGDQGALDLAPWRDLLTELVEELQKVRLRERIGRALRQAADMIDPPTTLR
jgi:hypothetical protein